MKAKRLIEVALPIKEISTESVRDKSLRHGHISTLHLWWARRPLPACRAIVFASLVPDPLDDNCPIAFKDAISGILGNNDKYTPYKDIPYTSIYDPVEDNLRTRLMMFIGKFSDRCQKDMIEGRTTPPSEQLSNGSLIKWENRNNPQILKIARKLIWIAYNSEKNSVLSYEALNSEFENSYRKILDAEANLYNTIDRDRQSNEINSLETTLNNAVNAFQRNMPSVFDPFAGGGAIPLEAARLGCRSFGNDINPVAHIVEKGTAEFPQKYGKPIKYSSNEFVKKYGKEGIILYREKYGTLPNQDGVFNIPNRLSFDVEFYAKKILNLTEDEVGFLYPKDKNGNKPVAFFWTRLATCSNPSCGAKIPMLRQLYIANTKRNKYSFNSSTSGNIVKLNIIKGQPIIEEWNHRGNLTCPCCGNLTDINIIKKESIDKKLDEELVAVITETAQGKQYNSPSDSLLDLSKQDIKPSDGFKPMESLEVTYTQALPCCTWGITHWGDLFSNRQLFMLEHLLNNFNKIKESLAVSSYGLAVITYLAMWFDRIALANTSFSRWHVTRETLEHPYSRQAIPMAFDFPESNPFCTSSGSALNQLDWIISYIDSESDSIFPASFANSSSGEKTQFEEKSLTAVVTDPPYYDAIAYADISDFFYVWLKRTLGDVYPINFSTPLTPKSDECTALKHHHNQSEVEAKQHFENKLTQIFDAIEIQTSDIVSIMFAHQSTEAWTTLCNSILGARMNIMGSWPMDTEMANRAVGQSGAALESSVTVACRPSERKGYGDYKEVRDKIKIKVKQEVEYLYELGFRGADLLTACFGQAVSEFGRYKVVERADGSEVKVAELLELSRNEAFNTLLEGVKGDNYTKFYVGWLQLNGPGDSDYDDVTKFTRVGLPINIHDIISQKLLIQNGKKQHLATAAEHLGSTTGRGMSSADPVIDQVHRAMLLYKGENRSMLLKLIREVATDANGAFWRLLASLKELLPAGDDFKQVQGLLLNADSLRKDSLKDEERQIAIENAQGILDFEVEQ